jgi:hypothetical protein
MPLPIWLRNVPLPKAPESKRGTPMSAAEFNHRLRTGGLSVDQSGRVGRREHMRGGHTAVQAMPNGFPTITIDE